MDDKNKQQVEVLDYSEIRDYLYKKTGLTPENDDLLEAAYEDASDKIYSIVAGYQVNADKFEAVMVDAVKKMTVYYYNRTSEEGIKTRTQDEEGVTWLDYPIAELTEAIKRTIVDGEGAYDLIVLGRRGDPQSSVNYSGWFPYYVKGSWYFYQ